MKSRPPGPVLSLFAALAIVAAACGGSEVMDPTAAPAAGPTETPEVTAPAPSPVDGDPAPTTEFVTFDGEVVTLSSYVGKPVVLNFWASWCPSCVAEMSSAFRPVQEDLGDEVTFIGMNIQDDRALAEGLLEETGVIWVSAEDPVGDLYIELGGIAMPFTVYISADGRIIEKHNGPLTENQLRDQIAGAFG